MQHSLTNEFVQSNLDFCLIPTITRLTRITQSSTTLIDNIIVSQNLCGSFVSSVLINDISDHLPTACVIPALITSKKGPVTITSRDTRPKNMVALKRQLSLINWAEELQSNSCSKNMDTFTQKVTEIVERCIPEQTRHINHTHLCRELWLTLSIKRSIEKNKRLYNESLKCPSRLIAYKTYNSTLQKIIRRAKSTFYKYKCKEFKTQTKQLWRLINEIAGKKNDKSNLIEYLKIDGIQTYSATKISNSFAKYFFEVGKKFADKIPAPLKSITDYLRMMGNHTKSIFYYQQNRMKSGKLPLNSRQNLVVGMITSAMYC